MIMEAGHCVRSFFADFCEGHGEGGAADLGERACEWRPDLDGGVDYFSGFGVGGRTFFQFLGILFYFWSRAGWIWSRR